MAKIIAICGKICCGKSYYAAELKEKENAVILSCDELTKDLFDNDLGDKHDEMALRIWAYFKKKSVELVKAGCTVILDWGFWSQENRKSLKEFYREQNIPCEWHYIDVEDETWKRNIEERNCRVLAGEGGSDYYLDEGLMEKLLSIWEDPAKEEIDVWYRLVRGQEMDMITLIEPTETYAEDIWAFRQEIFEYDTENEDQFAGCLSLDTCASSKEWIDICRLRKSAETCQQAGSDVPSHMFLAVRESDLKIVGIIDLRHHIDHPILGTWGGHSGYTVRPTERGKGYAKEMLRLNLLKAKDLGITRFLVTCNVDNTASEKIILANGGIFEKMIEVDGSQMKRYWIEIM